MNLAKPMVCRRVDCDAYPGPPRTGPVGAEGVMEMAADGVVDEDDAVLSWSAARASSNGAGMPSSPKSPP